MKQKSHLHNHVETNRRDFVKNGVILTLAGVAAISFPASCGSEKETGEAEEVSPPEDLMQEHGVLNRVLLIYDTCRDYLVNKKTFPMEELAKSATIIRTFIEDYHEKQEEQYLFPRFAKAGQLTDLVDTLTLQHRAGRRITEQILQLSGLKSLNETENGRLLHLLSAFNSMYRPHEAREDTVLFPAFRKIVSKNEYHSLGEEFEKNEHRLFGEDGFETIVSRVADIEKTLGIYELSHFTPQE